MLGTSGLGITVQYGMYRVLELKIGGQLVSIRERHGSWVANLGSQGCVGLTNSATSFALPFSDNLCTLDLSLSLSREAIVRVRMRVLRCD